MDYLAVLSSLVSHPVKTYSVSAKLNLELPTNQS